MVLNSDSERMACETQAVVFHAYDRTPVTGVNAQRQCVGPGPGLHLKVHVAGQLRQFGSHSVLTLFLVLDSHCLASVTRL